MSKQQTSNSHPHLPLTQSEASGSRPELSGATAGGGRGARGEAAQAEHMFYERINPYLNHYRLIDVPITSYTTESGSGLLPSLFSDLPEYYMNIRSFSDFLAFLSYHVGLLNQSDLGYYYGFDINSGARAYFTRLTNAKAFRCLEGAPTFGSPQYYIFNPMHKRFSEYPYDGKMSPCAFAYNSRIPFKTIPHTYGTGLAQLLFRLYQAHFEGYVTSFSTEQSIGNFSDAKNKASAEVTIDALARVSLGEQGQMYACIEYDTGSERYPVLLNKFKDYIATDLYGAERSVFLSSMFFVYHDTSLKIDFKVSKDGIPDFIAFFKVYACISAYYFFVENCLEASMFADNDISHLLNATFYKTICKTLPMYLADDNKVDNLLSFLGDKVESLKSKGFLDNSFVFDKDFLESILMDTSESNITMQLKAISCICEYMGIEGIDSKTAAGFIPFYLLDSFMDTMHHAGELLRISYNEEIYRKCNNRKYGLLKAIFNEIKLKSHYIDKDKDASFVSVGLPIDKTIYFKPLQMGYMCYFYPLEVLTNALDMYYYNRDSFCIRNLEQALCNTFKVSKDSLQYYRKSETVEVKEIAQGNYLNSYILNGELGRTLVNVEYLSGDLGACYRTIVNCNEFKALNNTDDNVLNKYLVLMVDKLSEARYFVSHFLNKHKGFTADYNMIDYGSDDSISLKDYFSSPFTRILFALKTDYEVPALCFYMVDPCGHLIKLQ